MYMHAFYQCPVHSCASQMCPRYRGGYTLQNAIQNSQTLGIYLNTSPGDLIHCDGTVYAWHYCYYPNINSSPSTGAPDAVFGVYYFDTVSENYILRQDSLYSLHLAVKESTFSCGTVSLNESDHFQVYEGDSVGVCLSERVDERLHQLNIVASYSRGSAVYWSSQYLGCSETEIQLSDEDFQQNRPFVAHLFVKISKSNYKLQPMVIIIIAFLLIIV